MKKINIAYWIVTALFAGMMIFSAIPNIMVSADSVKLVHDALGYPEYLIPLLGWGKLVGAIVILIPGFPRLKEWAYAGLTFDLAGATYSMIALGMAGFEGMFLFLAFAFGSYFLYHRRRKMFARRQVTSTVSGNTFASA